MTPDTHNWSDWKPSQQDPSGEYRYCLKCGDKCCEIKFGYEFRKTAVQPQEGRKP